MLKTLALDWVEDNRRGRFLDFVVSGRSLFMEMRRRGYDLVPRLSGKLVPLDVEARDLLLLEREGDTESGRVALYVCAGCGDYGCGVVSAMISRIDSDIQWSDFVWEQGPEVVPIENLGPFRFREDDYRKTIQSGS